MFPRFFTATLIALAAGSVFAAADAPTGYTKCAQTGATCAMSGTHLVVMGKSGVFSATKTLTGSFACTLANFPDAPSNASWCSYNPATASASSSTASSTSSSVASSSSSSVASSTSSATSSVAGAPLPPQNAIVPPLAFEDTHITVVWEKPSTTTGVTGYRVYANGTLKGTTSVISWPSGITNQQLYFDITGLTASTAYSIVVRAVNASGVESANSNTVTQTTTATPTVINITAAPYNAVAGTAINTIAIQKAINACPVGGKVLIPTGTFKSGALYLKSDCTYQVDGTLQGSDVAADYEFGNNRFPIYGTTGFGTVKYPDNYKSLLNTCGKYTDWTARTGYVLDNLCNDKQNIRITGTGHITGSSGTSADAANSGYHLTTLSHNQRAAQGGDNLTGDPARADLISLTGVRGLYIANLKFTLPASHMIFVARSSNITVANITTLSFVGGSKGLHNGDGIDLSTAYATSLTTSGPTGLLPTNAYIFGSTWDNGDDCINLNAGTSLPGYIAATPVNGVRVFNNYAMRGHGGVVLGSFTAAGFKNIAITENTFNGTEIALRFKTGKNRGGGIATLGAGDFGVIATDNKVAAIIDAAVSIMASYTDSSFADAPSAGTFRDITVNGLTGTVASGGYGVETTGNTGTEHTNIKMSNINITGSGVKGFSIYGTKGAPANTMFTNLTTAVGTFYYDATGLLSASNFASCSPAPTAK